MQELANIRRQYWNKDIENNLYLFYVFTFFTIAVICAYNARRTRQFI